jgi:hypothetical protein
MLITSKEKHYKLIKTFIKLANTNEMAIQKKEHKKF